VSRKPLLISLAALCLAMSGLFAASASADAGGLKILLLQADSGTLFSPTLQSLIAAEPGVDRVDTFDLHSQTPTLDQMKAYDEVIVTDADQPSDPTALGDVLADYEDAGGVVVATTFVWQASGDRVTGRWEDDGYSPYVPSNVDDWGDATLASFDATSPLMQGVTSLGAYYRDNLALTTGATQVAEWSDGAGAVAYKGNAVAITGYFGDDDYGEPGQRSGDFARIMVNAGKWLGPQTLTVTRGGSGAGTVTSDVAGISCGATCAARYSRGSHVTLSATPAAGSTFAGWTGDCSGAAATCTVTLDAARNVSAVFAAVPPPPPTAGAAKFRLLVHSVTINLRTGKGRLKLRCSNVSADRCVFNLAIQLSGPAHSSKRRLTKIGTAKGTVAGGHTGFVTIKLTRKGRSLLAAARHHRLKVALIGTSKNRQGSASKVKQKLTLKGKGR
jgi:List-Bact-rpt repeat protein